MARRRGTGIPDLSFSWRRAVNPMHHKPFLDRKAPLEAVPSFCFCRGFL